MQTHPLGIESHCGGVICKRDKWSEQGCNRVCRVGTHTPVKMLTVGEKRALTRTICHNNHKLSHTTTHIGCNLYVCLWAWLGGCKQVRQELCRGSQVHIYKVTLINGAYSSWLGSWWEQCALRIDSFDPQLSISLTFTSNWSLFDSVTCAGVGGHEDKLTSSQFSPSSLPASHCLMCL